MNSGKKARLIAFGLVLLCGILAGVGLGAVTDSGDEPSTDQTSTDSPSREETVQGLLDGAVEEIKSEANGFEGTIGVAINREGWDRPAVSGEQTGDGLAPLGEMAIPVAAVASLREKGAADLPSNLSQALAGSATWPCELWFTTNDLQGMLAGSEDNPEEINAKAKEKITQVLTDAGATDLDDSKVTAVSLAPECPDPGGIYGDDVKVPGFDTARWSVADAALFGQALAAGTDGVYGQHGQPVAEALRQRTGAREPGLQALAAWNPLYISTKYQTEAGSSGVQQVAGLEDVNDESVGVAVAIEPAPGSYEDEAAQLAAVQQALTSLTAQIATVLKSDPMGADQAKPQK